MKKLILAAVVAALSLSTSAHARDKQAYATGAIVTAIAWCPTVANYMVKNSEALKKLVVLGEKHIGSTDYEAGSRYFKQEEARRHHVTCNAILEGLVSVPVL